MRIHSNILPNLSGFVNKYRIKIENTGIITDINRPKSAVKKENQNMNSNNSIKCDVTKCRHNLKGCNCQLDTIKVTCGCADNQTCCDSFSEKNEY